MPVGSIFSVPSRSCCPSPIIHLDEASAKATKVLVGEGFKDFKGFFGGSALRSVLGLQVWLEPVGFMVIRAQTFNNRDVGRWKQATNTARTNYSV